MLKQRQGLLIACIGEVAYRMSSIDAGAMIRLADGLKDDYGSYLRQIVSSRVLG